MSFDRMGKKLLDTFHQKMIPKLYELIDELGLDEVIIEPEGLKRFKFSQGESFIEEKSEETQDFFFESFDILKCNFTTRKFLIKFCQEIEKKIQELEDVCKLVENSSKYNLLYERKVLIEKFKEKDV